MLLVPLLAASGFKCQLNAYNFVTVTECFMWGFSTDRGPPTTQVCAPQLKGHFHLRVCVCVRVCDSSCERLTVQCSLAQVSSCSYLLNVIVSTCVSVWLCTNTCLAVALGHRQVQVPPKQTSSATRSWDICAQVCVNVYLSQGNGVCDQHTVCPLRSSFTLRDCVTQTCQRLLLCQFALHHPIALDHTGIAFWHFVSQLIFGHVIKPMS